MNQIVGRALILLKSDLFIDITPPSLVIGEKLFLVINRNESIKMSFRLSGDVFNLCYSLE